MCLTSKFPALTADLYCLNNFNSHNISEDWLIPKTITCVTIVHNVQESSSRIARALLIDNQPSFFKRFINASISFFFAATLAPRPPPNIFSGRSLNFSPMRMMFLGSSAP